MIQTGGSERQLCRLFTRLIAWELRQLALLPASREAVGISFVVTLVKFVKLWGGGDPALSAKCMLCGPQAATSREGRQMKMPMVDGQETRDES